MTAEKTYRYNKDMGIEAVAYIQSIGYEQAKLVGSLSTLGYSNHDIDILIPIKKIVERKKCARELVNSLLNPETYYSLAHEQVYLNDTCFGDINIFFY